MNRNRGWELSRDIGCILRLAAAIQQRVACDGLPAGFGFGGASVDHPEDREDLLRQVLPSDLEGTASFTARVAISAVRPSSRLMSSGRSRRFFLARSWLCPVSSFERVGDASGGAVRGEYRDGCPAATGVWDRKNRRPSVVTLVPGRLARRRFRVQALDSSAADFPCPENSPTAWGGLASMPQSPILVTGTASRIGGWAEMPRPTIVTNPAPAHPRHSAYQAASS